MVKYGEHQYSLISVTAPLSNQGPTIPVGPPYANPSHATWRPSRASAWTRTCGLLTRVSATCASRGPAVALPRRIHALVPRATSARRLGLLATSSPTVSSPLFRDLNKEKFIKKSIKNQLKFRKRAELS